ncbi:hypothetical protein D3C77_327410 [compost metagenome]
MNAHLGQFWQQRLDLVPDPFGDHFAGRVFQARNVVQVVVVQLFIQRLEDRLDLGKVANPASMRVQRAGQVQGNLERMTVQTAALVPFRNVRQTVCRLEGELFENFHDVSTLKANAGKQFTSMTVTAVAVARAACRFLSVQAARRPDAGFRRLPCASSVGGCRHHP